MAATQPLQSKGIILLFSTRVEDTYSTQNIFVLAGPSCAISYCLIDLAHHPDDFRYLTGVLLSGRDLHTAVDVHGLGSNRLDGLSDVLLI